MAQEITVTGVDDDVLDGPQNYAINLWPATSSDIDYDGLVPDSVAVINLDNDSFVTAAIISNGIRKATAINLFPIGFIARGSYLEPHIKTLREFRDKYLLNSFSGKLFLRFYDKVSPNVVDFIKKHDNIKTIARYAITPIVLGVVFPKTSLTFLLLLLMSFSYITSRRRPITE